MDSETDIEWGAMFALGTDTTTVEPYPDRMKAWAATGGRGQLVYREVTYHEWTDDPNAEGNVFGVRRTWENDHVEVEPCASRHEAEQEVRAHNARRFGSIATVVSRIAEYSAWLPADTRVGH